MGGQPAIRRLVSRLSENLMKTLQRAINHLWIVGFNSVLSLSHAAAGRESARLFRQLSQNFLISGRSCALFINGRATCDKAFGFKAFRESYENPPKGNKPLMDCGFQFCSVIVSCRSRQGICPVISAIEPKLSYMAFPLPCPLRFMPAGDRPAFRDGPGRFPPGSAAPRACPECWGYRPFAP